MTESASDRVRCCQRRGRCITRAGRVRLLGSPEDEQAAFRYHVRLMRRECPRVAYVSFQPAVGPECQPLRPGRGVRASRLGIGETAPRSASPARQAACPGRLLLRRRSRPAPRSASPRQSRAFALTSFDDDSGQIVSAASRGANDAPRDRPPRSGLSPAGACVCEFVCTP